MEPGREEQQKALEPNAGQKPKRFRIVKLEERIAPKRGGKGTNNCGGTHTCPPPTVFGPTCQSYDCTWQQTSCYCATVYPAC